MAATLRCAIWILTALFMRKRLQKGIAKNVEKRFDRSGYSRDKIRPLPIGKNKRVIDLMKDELGGKIMTDFVALRAKIYVYRKIDK